MKKPEPRKVKGLAKGYTIVQLEPERELQASSPGNLRVMSCNNPRSNDIHVCI